jgi:hypothetical protein
VGTVVHDMKTTTIIVGAVFTAAALVGLLGYVFQSPTRDFLRFIYTLPSPRFFGAIFRKHGFIKTFYILLCLVLSLEIGASIYYLVTFYRKRGQPLNQCINGSTDNNIINYCKSIDKFKHIPQAAMIAAFVVPLLVHAYACYVVSAYSKRLQHQRLDKVRESQLFVPPTSTGSSYQPVMRADESRPLTSQYPYTDAPNSFGAHKV